MAKAERTPKTNVTSGNQAGLARLARRFKMGDERLDLGSARAAMQLKKDELAMARRAQREANAARLRATAGRQIAAQYAAELAQSERDIEAIWRRFRCRVKAAPKAKLGAGGSPKIVPRGVARLPSYRRPIVDRHGRRGVFMNVRYHSANTTSAGVASRCVAYIFRPGATERIDGGDAVLSNVGMSIEEISAGFALIETLNRAARKNAKVVHTMVLTLPHDVAPQVRLNIVREFCEETFGAHDLPFIAALHTPSAEGNQRNFHAHIIFSMRPCVRLHEGEWSVSSELRSEFDNEDAFFHMRQLFAETMTRNVRAAGIRRTYTHLSNTSRGLKAKPLTKLGQSKTAAARRHEYVPEVERMRRQIAINEELLTEDRSARRKAQAEHGTAELAGAQIRAIDAMSLIEARQNIGMPSVLSPIGGDRAASILPHIRAVAQDPTLECPARIAIVGIDTILDPPAPATTLPHARPLDPIDLPAGLILQKRANAPRPLSRLIEDRTARALAPLRLLAAPAQMTRATRLALVETDKVVRSTASLASLETHATLPPASRLPLLQLAKPAHAMNFGRVVRVDEGQFAACTPIGVIEFDRPVRLTGEDIRAPHRPRHSAATASSAPQEPVPSPVRKPAPDKETQTDIARVCAIIQGAPGRLNRPYRGYMLPDWTVLPPEQHAAIERADLKHPVIRAAIEERAHRDEIVFAGDRAAVSPARTEPATAQIQRHGHAKSVPEAKPDPAAQALESWRRARADNTEELERQRLAALAMAALGADRLAAINDGERARLWNDAEKHRRRLVAAHAMQRGPERS